MKLSTFIVLLGLFCASCTFKIQVVTLRGSNLKPTNEGLVLDNDTLTLRYSFASERGLMNITLVNKLNRPLYVDWQRSSFITGKKTFTYWHDIANVNLASSGYIYQYGRSGFASASLSTTGTIDKEVSVAFIPPHSQLTKQQFVVFPTGIVPTSGTPDERREPARWSSKKLVNVSTYFYQNVQSPLRFRNYLTLSTTKEFATEFGIDTQFWASDIRIEPESQAVNIVYKTPDGRYVDPKKTFSQKDGFFIPLP